MKKNKVKNQFLAELRKIPIIEVACEKVAISRVSLYRWKNSDKDFEKEMETALAEGEALINDISESQLLTLIKDKNWNALSFWFRHRNPKFRDKVEVTAKIERNESLTPEQESLFRKAIGLSKTILDNKHNHE